MNLLGGKPVGDSKVKNPPTFRISIGMPNFEMPNLDCTSKEISIQSTIVPVRKTLVQWLTESRFGISKFGIPIEIRSLRYLCLWGLVCDSL